MLSLLCRVRLRTLRAGDEGLYSKQNYYDPAAPLMKKLAIRLAQQKTLGKSLVIPLAGEGLCKLRPYQGIWCASAPYLLNER
jgi:hypothetical protein